MQTRSTKKLVNDTRESPLHPGITDEPDTGDGNIARRDVIQSVAHSGFYMENQVDGGLGHV